MVTMAEACDECTRNCLLMHKKEKNPSPVAATFFKVMFGDDYSKVLFLPPRFAHTVRNMVGKRTELEDSSGERWTVKFTDVDGLLAFEEGWNAFWLDHGLKVGDFLVFHYIMESHFVVLMYGQSGCPEVRHFGLVQHHPNKTRKNGELIAVDHSPSNVNTNGHHCLYQSSSQSERSVYGANEHPETRLSLGAQHKENKTKKKMSQKHSVSATISPDVNTTNTDHPVFASVSDKEMSQRSEPLVRNMDLDNLISETPTMKQHCLVNNHNGNVEDECRKNDSNDLLIHEINPDGSDYGWENNVAVRGGGDETQINESGRVLETRSMERKRLKESTVVPSKHSYNNSIKKRLRGANVPITQTKMGKIEQVAVWASETDALGSRLHDAGLSTSPRILCKPKAKPMEAINKEANKDRGSNGVIEETDDILPSVKPEPLDYDEAPPSGATNTSFSAVMRSYQYLELPEWVKLTSKVILLRNDNDLWPVLYQDKVGLKVLTQSWGLFAREKGIEPGDECEFVLEREAKGKSCNVFKVHVTRK